MQVPSNSSLTQTISESRKEREFPGGLVVRILGFNCCGPGSIPCLETEVLQGAWHSQKKKKKDKNSQLILIGQYYLDS